MKYDHIHLPFSSPTSPNVAPKILSPSLIIISFSFSFLLCFPTSLQHLINAANIRSRTRETCQWPHPQKKKKSLSPSSTVRGRALKAHLPFICAGIRASFILYRSCRCEASACPIVASVPVCPLLCSSTALPPDSLCQMSNLYPVKLCSWSDDSKSS